VKHSSFFIYAVLFLLITGNASAQSQSPFSKWEWLKGSSWYVPQEYLPAIERDLETQELQAVVDQTVFTIEDYANGYFWGRGVVQIPNTPALCVKLMGSVTPEGNLHISFTTIVPGVPAELAPKATGTGNMRFQHDQWAMQLQMTSGFKKLLTHWANMALCRQGEECNRRLPGLQISLQELLNKCNRCD
jgi:hypothetical protein